MRIFYDIDTQHDFMDEPTTGGETGRLYVPGAEEIKTNVMDLTAHAATNNILRMGSVDKHFATPEFEEREGELQRYGGPFPDHCMDRTYGQRKILESLPTVQARTDYNDLVTFVPHDLRNSIDPSLLNGVLTRALEEERSRGIYFEKQSYDVFTNPAIEAVLERAGVKEAVVYGVATDYCVKAAALGMQQRGIQTYVVTDAVKGVAPETTQSALEEMAAAGAKFVTTEDVLEGRI